MYIQKTQKGLYYWLALSAVFVLLFIAGTWIFPNRSVWAADEQGEYQEYPDRAGHEALRLWTERERDRAMAAAARRYWDYWLSRPSRQYSAHRLWLKMDRIQKWLKDPEHNPPPPPPPLPPPHWVPPYYPPYPYGYPYSLIYPYPYPYAYYYPPPYHETPPVGPPPADYVYPGVSENPKDLD